MHLLARRWLLVLLLFAATGSQTLGLLHQTVHESAASGEHAHDGLHERHGPLDALFGLDGDGLACQLLDQLVHGAGPSAVAIALPLALVPSLLPWLQQAAPGRRSAPFHARGPPLVR